MNWEVHKVVKLTSRMVDEADDVCEHLKVGDTCHCIGEQDSFGPVSRFYECADCRKKSRESADEVMEFCHDCGTEHPRKDMRQWRWFDFYAPQGDEPLEICNCCWEAPKHQERMLRDRQNKDAEYNETRY